jgi:hypothetical protein
MTRTPWILRGNSLPVRIKDCSSHINLGGGLGIVHDGPPGYAAQVFHMGNDLLKARFVVLGDWLTGEDAEFVQLTYRLTGAEARMHWHLFHVGRDATGGLDFTAKNYHASDHRTYPEAESVARKLLGLKPRQATRARPAAGTP